LGMTKKGEKRKKKRGKSEMRERERNEQVFY
jgi:hypothetical protein